MTEVHVLVLDHCESASIEGVYQNKADAEAEMNNPDLLKRCEFAYIETCELR